MSCERTDSLFKQDSSSKIQDKWFHPIRSVICSTVCTGLFTLSGTGYRGAPLLFAILFHWGFRLLPACL